MLTLLLALLTVRIVFRIAQETGGRGAGWIASLAWLAVLPQVYYAKTMNLDTPYVFWFALAALAFVRFRARPSLVAALAFGGAAAASILTKDQAYGLFLLPALYLIVESLRAGERGRRLGWLLAAAGGALALAASSYRIWSGLATFRQHRDALLAVPSTYAFRASDLDSPAERLVLGFRHIGWSFGLPLALIVAAALLLSLVRAFRAGEPANTGLALLLFPLSYAIFSLAPLGYHYDRFFLPVCLVLAVVAGVALARGLERTPNRLRRNLASLGIALAVAWGAARAVAINFAMTGDRRFELERSTAGLQRATFYSFEVRPPHGFERHRVRRGDTIPAAALSAFEVVAIPAPDMGELALSRLAARLEAGECGFRSVLPELRAASRIHRFPGFDGVLSNLGEIDPPLLVFRRDPPLAPCADPAPAGGPT